MTDLFVLFLTAMITAVILWRFWKLILAILILGCFAMIFIAAFVVYTGVQQLI